MEKEQIVQLLQYRRHDLVNEIQVIDGYASMQMFDKVQEKLDDFMYAIDQERKLHMLETPHFILWIEMFRMQQENFKLTYEIADMIDFRTHDEWITNICEKLIKEIQQHLNENNKYDIHIYMSNNIETQAYIQMTIQQVDDYLYESVSGFLNNLKDSGFTFSYTGNKLTCEFQIDGTIEG